MKTAIVVSGGDAPGINAAIHNYQRLADAAGDEVLGARAGFAGLLQGDLDALDRSTLALHAGRGGSILRSSREVVLADADSRDRLHKIMADIAIDNLLLFGGDGTIQYVLPLLQSWDLPCIALPATIDNDVAGTDYTLGHDSACNFALSAVDGIRATANALPGRIFMLETLGAPGGHLALAVAYACAAHAVLLPEYEFHMNWLATHLRAAVSRDGHAIVVLSEAVPAIADLAQELPQRTGIRLRYSALGHAQRGADASHYDRQLAREMSRLAHQALKSGIRHGAVVTRDKAPVMREGALPQREKPPPDPDLYRRINGL